MSELQLGRSTPLANSTCQLDLSTRTDGRTNEEGSCGCRTSFGSRRATRAYDGMATIGEVIELGFMPGSERHEVIRTGERQPIASHVRSAVWFRDHGQCELCGTSEQANPWELDHIVPWSAGGSDDTTNLRVLCQRHNQQRSNFIDPRERPKRPATWWCLNCYSADRAGKWWSYVGGTVYCPIHIGSRACAVIRNYRWLRDNTDEMPTWHQRDPIEHAHTVAYCAHCKTPGLTDMPL